MKGIRGLIPLLKSIQKPVQISEYAGQRVAVDGHGWLHGGAFSCASELARGIETDAYVTYFMDLVRMLRLHNVIPIIVFDGQELPMKLVINKTSANQRKVKLEKGNVLFGKGKVTEANKCFQKAFSITPAMISKIIKELDQLNVQHIVAPYEAHSQITYLLNSGQAKVVITEDSNVLTFGSSKVIFNMDSDGRGQQVVHQDLLQLMKLNAQELRYVCILSGCEYLSSLRGIGLKTAQDIVRRRRTLNEIVKEIQNRYTKHVAENYIKKFVKINAAFMYQFVFDMNLRTYVRLNPLPKDIKVVGLGDSPQNCNIPILESNKAIVLNQVAILNEANKENINPCVGLGQIEFSEMKSDFNILKGIENTLKKVEPNKTTIVQRPPGKLRPYPLPRYTPSLCSHDILAKRKNTFANYTKNNKNRRL